MCFQPVVGADVLHECPCYVAVLVNCHMTVIKCRRSRVYGSEINNLVSLATDDLAS